MIDHVSVSVTNLEAARTFYVEILEKIGLCELVSREHSVGFGKSYPEFWLNERPNMGAVAQDCGAHVCFRCPSKDAVIGFHTVALAKGGSDAGMPRDRQGAQTPYFGAFIFDLDGNKIEVVTFPREATA
ncbi:VOC family protein [Roseobacter litoralis]|uniref:VOC family protein n=1 Tax=Roseobacter litoralis TaxID=42443 RepID=UPI002492E1AF|nr:VOC family protein [Roseobacter litoralis]